MLKVTLRNGEVVEGDNAAELMHFVMQLSNNIRVRVDKKVETESIRVAQKSVMKRKYNKKKPDYSFWTGPELYFISRNLEVTTTKLVKELKGRTYGAISSVKWAMKHNRLNSTKAKVLADYMKTL